MYEEYSHQALPPKYYRELIGSAICVFNSNNSFIIENILHEDTNGVFSWYGLIDQTSGCLNEPIKQTIGKKSVEIAELFDYICQKRNRIVHSFQITDKDGEQKLATKDKTHKQFVITDSYLLEFIEENEKLSSLLHDYRGH